MMPGYRRLCECSRWGGVRKYTQDDNNEKLDEVEAEKHMLIQMEKNLLRVIQDNRMAVVASGGIPLAVEKGKGETVRH
jgi:hypothetical protein